MCLAHPRAHGGIAFWLALLLVWSAACYFLAARPAAEGYAGFARLYEQRVASPSEFALLVVSLAVPLLPFALILSDFLFTVLLAAVAWLSAQQLGLGRLTRFRQLVRGFDAVGRRYAAALIADAQRPPAACFGSPSPRAGASDELCAMLARALGQDSGEQVWAHGKGDARAFAAGMDARRTLAVAK